MINDNRGDKILAQARPAGTAAVSAYSPAANRRALISRIVMANTTALAVAAYVYVHASGTTFDETTTILFAKAVPANDSISIDFANYLELEDAGNIGVRHATGSAINFTVIGRLQDVL